MNKPTLVQGGKSLVQIKSALVERIRGDIDEFALAEDQNGNPNPKMALSLVAAVANAIEIMCGSETHAYITRRLTEQIERYIELDFHSHAGYTRESFRVALQPIVEKTLQFFKPPSPRPLRDGEFSVLLVLPTTWVTQRRLSATFLNDKLADEISSLGNSEVRIHGKESPSVPYVLLGIDGGRGLIGHSITEADAVLTRNGDTYLSMSELMQLLLVRPHFLSVESDFTQSEVFVLAEKYNAGLVRFVATKDGIKVESTDEKNIHGGRGVGKPHYAKMITM